MEYTVERVGPGDASTLARIHTESWRAAFGDIVSPEVIRAQTAVDRVETLYREVLEGNTGNGYLLKVEGEPQCMAWWAAAREETMPGYAELICIHSLPGRWRTGCGSRLLDTVLRDMAAAGYDRVMLWVFEQNMRARAFYERHGFVPQSRVKLSWGAPEICCERALRQGLEP